MLQRVELFELDASSNFWRVMKTVLFFQLFTQLKQQH